MTTEPIPKPAPHASALTEPFWAAANERRLAIQRCQGCRAYQHPPAPVCPECRSSELAFETVSGTGRVKSFTISHDAAHPAFRELRPYAVAVVELDEQDGIYLLSNLPGVAVEDVAIGLPVQVEFEAVAPDRLIPQFRPRPRT